MRETSTQAYPLPSSADMFLFFKRTIKEATKLSTDPNTLLVSLIPVFRKCLRGYAHGYLLMITVTYFNILQMFNGFLTKSVDIGSAWHRWSIPNVTQRRR
jgi:hypothetical protein